MVPSTDEVIALLSWLHRHPNLPKNPTAVCGPFELTQEMRDRVSRRTLSSPTLESVAHHMANFLGILVYPRVQLGIESTRSVLLHPSQVKDLDRCGYYAVRGAHSEIGISVKHRFRIENVLAILAHEISHAYLRWWRIERSNRQENEILTDLAATYFGFGGFLVKGYREIRWRAGSTLHHVSIGYLDVEAVRFAIATACRLRKLPWLAQSLSFFHRIFLDAPLFPALTRRPETGAD